MARVIDVEPMINMYEKSEDYGKAFGVKLYYSNGRSRRFSDLGLALCAPMGMKKRMYIEELRKKIERGDVLLERPKKP